MPANLVRVTHRPTGLVAESHYHRSQFRNRETAVEILRGLLYLHRTARSPDGLVRSYSLNPPRVEDEATGISTDRVSDVLEGNLDLIYPVDE
jgi:protein subunit release factor A